MKKFLFALISVFCLSSSLAAFEWGGLVKEDFKYTSTDFTPANNSFRQSNTASIWFKEPLSPKGSWYIANQESYKYYLDFSNENKVFTSIFDIDLLKLSGQVQVGNYNLSTAIGRFSLSDLTGKVFNQTADGIYLNLSRPSVNYGFYFGYTGFLNSLNVTMLDGNGVGQIGRDSIYSFAHKYIPISISVEVPNCFLNQTFKAQVNAFFDNEDNFQRYYLELGLNGHIMGPLYYTAVSCFGFANLNTISNFTTLNLQIFMGSILRLKIGTDYASGSQLIFKPFIGFTSYTAYYSSALPELSGVILPNVDLSLSFGNFYTSMNVSAVLGYPENEIYLKGANASLNLMYNVYSDLQIGLTGLYYYDIHTSGAENYCSVNANISVSF